MLLKPENAKANMADTVVTGISSAEHKEKIKNGL